MTRNLLMTALLLVAGAGAASDMPELLSTEQAFRVEAHRIDAHVVDVTFTIAPGYALYRKRTSLSIEGVNPDLARTIWAKAQEHSEKFRGEVHAQIELSALAQGAIVVASAQGCADVGVCYQPFTRRIAITQ